MLFLGIHLKLSEIVYYSWVYTIYLEWVRGGLEIEIITIV